MEPDRRRRRPRGDEVLAAIAIAGVSLAVLLWAMQGNDATRRITTAEQGPGPAVFRPLDGPAPPPAAALEGALYVPVYSTLYLGDGLLQAGLSVTLSLHNVSPAHDLVVRRIDYHDTQGRLLRRLVDRPHAVPPMATAEFRIDRDDPSGGSGANYLVEWAAPPGGSGPLVEAVMVAPAGRLGISLVSRGVPVAPAGAPAGR